MPNIYFLWPVPLVTALDAFALWRWLERRREVLAVPRRDRAVPARLSRAGDLDLSLSRAAVADDLGDRRRAGEPDLHAGRHASSLLPIILGYIVFVYWVFRGKVREGEGYH